MAQLVLSLFLILLVVGVLLSAELDLLGTFILAVYSSVFIALSLLALHFGPFWMPATQQEGRVSFAPTLAVALGFLAALHLGAVGGPQHTLFFDTNFSWSSSFLWQDAYQDQHPVLSSAAGLLHWLFYRLLVLETVGLNVYLFLGLMGTLTFVCLRSLWLDAAAATEASLDGQLKPERLFDRGARLRAASRFRRQTRRTNTSQLRHR